MVAIPVYSPGSLAVEAATLAEKLRHLPTTAAGLLELRRSEVLERAAYVMEELARRMVEAELEAGAQSADGARCTVVDATGALSHGVFYGITSSSDNELDNKAIVRLDTHGICLSAFHPSRVRFAGKRTNIG